MGNVAFSTWRGEAGTHVEAPKIAEQMGDGRPVKAFMGWNGMIVRDPSVNAVDMAREYMARAQAESCGQCIPCRMGTRVMLEILERICAGQGTEADLRRLDDLARQVKDLSMCDIGQTTPIPILDALAHFREQFQEAIRQGKAISRGQYIAHTTAPCTNACPSHLDIPRYVEKIRLGQFEEALAVIRNDCSLPGTVGRVCVRPCEFNCRRGLLDEPISIKFLKRFAADYELEHGWDPPFSPVPVKKERVAIVGAGPAGLACAYYLGQRGYRSTIFESLPEPGGMAAVGIPDYRLPREILRREADLVEKLGAEIRYNVHVGRDITLEDLAAQKYGAVFLASGAHGSSKIGCEGEDQGYQGLLHGVVFLREIALGRKPIEGRKMVVIGGGNVAIDCVRTALRIGFEDVNLVYRRTEVEMPADKVEIHDAKEEKIQFHFLTQPIRVLAENGKVVGLECIRMELGEPDKSGRRRPVPVDGSNFTIDADAVVPAIGQFCVFDYVTPESGIALTRWSTLIVEKGTLRAEAQPVFGGGDCVSGPLTLIAAIADGKRAARFIVQYLETGGCVAGDRDHMENLVYDLGVFDKKEKMVVTGGQSRVQLKMMDPETRVHSFDEVEEGYGIPEAMKEASRCLRCYRIALVAV
jgi:formate dehydrogenase (NADP+) beta subunit